MKEYALYDKRSLLIDLLPLEAPLGVHILASSYCNFRCFYCAHSKNSDVTVGESRWLRKQFISDELFDRILSDMKEFPRKIKLVNFAWMGEPLMHPNIGKYVKAVKEANVAEEVSIVTNGSLLSKELSDQLIEAGLDRLRISIQGLDEKSYMDNCHYSLDYQSFLNNIEYYYTHKKNTRVYIKIMDCMINKAEDEALFRKLFEDKCDIINIEHLIPMHNDIELNRDTYEGHFGGETEPRDVCSFPFFEIEIGPQGELFPCCSISSKVDSSGLVHTAQLGSLKDESLFEY